MNKANAKHHPQGKSKYLVYLIRILWSFAWITVWQILPACLRVLRPTLLKLFGFRGDFVNLFHRTSWIEIPHRLECGRNCAFGPRSKIYNLGRVRIGDRSIISQDVYICAGTHDYEIPGLPLLTPDTTIGSDVWICRGAFIGPGVTIGNGAVVGANAVVTKNVSPHTVVAGNPARVIKQRKLTSDGTQQI